MIGVGRHSETLEELVVCRALYDDRDLWIRPLKMFIEKVEVDGKKFQGLNTSVNKMKAVIEMPKGDVRRRHIKYDKSGFIDLGPIKNVIPVNDGVMPVHYGYIPETLNEKELDESFLVIITSFDRSKTPKPRNNMLKMGKNNFGRRIGRFLLSLSPLVVGFWK